MGRTNSPENPFVFEFFAPIFEKGVTYVSTSSVLLCHRNISPLDTNPTRWAPFGECASTDTWDLMLPSAGNALLVLPVAPETWQSWCESNRYRPERDCWYCSAGKRTYHLNPWNETTQLFESLKWDHHIIWTPEMRPPNYLNPWNETTLLFEPLKWDHPIIWTPEMRPPYYLNSWNETTFTWASNKSWLPIVG